MIIFFFFKCMYSLKVHLKIYLRSNRYCIPKLCVQAPSHHHGVLNSIVNLKLFYFNDGGEGGIHPED